MLPLLLSTLPRENRFKTSILATWSNLHTDVWWEWKPLTLHLSERADWQYSSREKDAIECFMTRTSKGNRIACMFVRCSPNAKYTLLFSHGNAVDLGQMSSFYIGLGSRINCNIFSYDYSGYGASSESQQRRTCMQTWKLPGWLFGQDTAFVLKMWLYMARA